MKTFIFAAAFLGALSASVASASTTLNLKIQATDQQGNAVSSAQCQVVQNLSNADLTGTWTCSFNNGARQTLKTIATYIAPATSSSASVVDYDLVSGEDLGDFLFNGLNLKGAHDSDFMEIVLSSIPSLNVPFLMVGADDYSHYYYLNITVEYAGAQPTSN